MGYLASAGTWVEAETAAPRGRPRGPACAVHAEPPWVAILPGLPVPPPPLALFVRRAGGWPRPVIAPTFDPGRTRPDDEDVAELGAWIGEAIAAPLAPPHRGRQWVERPELLLAEEQRPPAADAAAPSRGPRGGRAWQAYTTAEVGQLLASLVPEASVAPPSRRSAPGRWAGADAGWPVADELEALFPGALSAQPARPARGGRAEQSRHELAILLDLTAPPAALFAQAAGPTAHPRPGTAAESAAPPAIYLDTLAVAWLATQAPTSAGAGRPPRRRTAEAEAPPGRWAEDAALVYLGWPGQATAGKGPAAPGRAPVADAAPLAVTALEASTASLVLGAQVATLPSPPRRAGRAALGDVAALQVAVEALTRSLEPAWLSAGTVGRGRPASPRPVASEVLLDPALLPVAPLPWAGTASVARPARGAPATGQGLSFDLSLVPPAPLPDVLFARMAPAGRRGRAEAADVPPIAVGLIVVAGPYYCVAGDLYWAGAAEGEVTGD